MGQKIFASKNAQAKKFTQKIAGIFIGWRTSSENLIFKTGF